MINIELQLIVPYKSQVWNYRAMSSHFTNFASKLTNPRVGFT